MRFNMLVFLRCCAFFLIGAMLSHLGLGVSDWQTWLVIVCLLVIAETSEKLSTRGWQDADSQRGKD